MNGNPDIQRPRTRHRIEVRAVTLEVGGVGGL